MNTPAERIAALRARGAERLDPLRFHFIEALARRTAATGGPARSLLENRLARALDDCTARCAAAPPPTAARPAAQIGRAHV